MYRSSELMQNKARVSVELLKDSGEELHGYFFLGGQERVLDLLNGPSTYLPFQLTNGNIHILNKSVIVRIIPHDEDRMAETNSNANEVHLGPVRPTA